MNSQIPEALLDLLDTPGLTDICIAENRTELDFGQGLTPSEQFLITEPTLSDLAKELIELGGRRLDHSSPFADVSLPGGIRVHAVLTSGCSPQTHISIRLHNTTEFNLESFLETASCSAQDAKSLQEISSSGDSFLIAGPTGSGKTTLLRALLADQNQRIIAIEDVTEIIGKNILNLQSKPKNIEGQGEISLSDLVRESLRMRPDRLVIGEVRGKELLTMLQALNTGHRGATTLHANSLTHVPERLLSIASAMNIPEQALARLTVSAFDWVISLGFEEGKRAVLGVGRPVLSELGFEVRRAPIPRRLALA